MRHVEPVVGNPPAVFGSNRSRTPWKAAIGRSLHRFPVESSGAGSRHPSFTCVAERPSSAAAAACKTVMPRGSEEGGRGRLQRLVRCPLVEVRELLFQPLDGGAPFGRRGLADGVLVAEQADL